MRTARRGQMTITDEPLLAPAERTSRARAGRWASLLLALVALLGGCASGATAHTSAAATATATPSAPADLAPVSMSAAWGAPVIRTLTTDLGNNQVFLFADAATPDGQWLVGVSVSRTQLNPGGESFDPAGPSYAVLYNVGTRQVVTMRQLLHNQSQMQGAAADAHWVVWSEADNPGDWALFAYNRDTGQTTQIVASAQSPAPWPALDQGKLLWSQFMGPVGPGTEANAVVRLDDLTTGVTTTLATSAGGIPELAWPWAAWSQVAAGDNGRIVFGALVVKSLESGQSVTLPQGTASVAISGTSVAYADQNSQSLYLLDDITRSTTSALTVAHSEDGDNAEYVSLDDRLVAWQSNHDVRVYDRAERRLVNLPDQAKGPIDGVYGHTLIWTVPDLNTPVPNQLGTATLDLLDTSTLPVLHPPASNP